jgi:acyl-[acyl-carrier-protein]-phospholipid O-acyltransferase / long-chain-fatty-acid--[acyl-carrier-protein] ligase
MSADTPPLKLLRTRRFGPLFAGLTIGAFGDNMFRQALVILIQFRLAQQLGIEAAPLVALAPGIFMLPYFLFSTLAGQLADKLDKARLMRWLKFTDIFIMAGAAASLVSGNISFMFIVLFLAGLQATFYSPVKYAILPQQLAPGELLTGNALVGAGTYLAILLGAILGGILVLLPHGPWLVGAAMICISTAGFISSLFIPPAPSAAPELKINLNIVVEMRNLFRQVLAQPTLGLIILGHAWFWFVSTLYVGQMPTLVHEVLHSTQGVFTLFFTTFSVGVALGALIVRQMLKGAIDGRYVALGSLGLAACGTALAIALDNFPRDEVLLTVSDFLTMGAGWVVTGLLLLLALFGGIYIVPLNALLQARAKEELRARTIAASNIIDSGAMVAASLFAVALLGLGLSIPTIWLIVALASFVALPVIITLIPQIVLKQIFQRLLRAAFDVKIEGLENLEKAGPKAVIVANHVSLLDGLLLATFLPGKPLFAVNSFIAQQWWVKPFLALIEAYLIDPTQPLAMKGLINRVAAGAHCVIFPEGRITTTGSLMKVNEGPGLIADKAGACIVPVRIEGAEYTRFSYLKGLVRRRTFPRLKLTVLPPQHFELPKEIVGRARRQLAGQKLYDLMSNLLFETSTLDETLVEALLDARDLHGGGKLVLEDRERQPISYNRVLTGLLVLSRFFKDFAPRGGRVGVLLPNANATAVVFFALLHIGRTPAMLNFTAGLAACRAACAAATLTHVITSRKFIELARLEPLIEGLSTQVKIVYLEDIRAQIGVFHKLCGLLCRPFIRYLHRRHEVKAEEAAVVLFTSGSEGVPKGVVLSHRNLLANRWQVGARLDFSGRDIVLNALPLFHSMGLTGGLLVPLMAGARVMLYPSPLHYRIVPLLAYDCNATVLFGTDTFLTGYARTAHPYDFYSLRFVLAGAEKLKDETRRLYAEKYGVRILEGYGATETAPAISLNTFMHNKAGTVGRLLPGMKAKLKAVPGITEGGRLFVTGPNIMMGYLKVEAPGVLQPPEQEDGEHWHDTGDIVSMDEQGYIRILGRAKHFAKIAGEMISLGAVEAMAERCWPGFAHAVVALPDARKGEQLVLITTKSDAQLSELQAKLREEEQTELMLPRQLIHMAELPLLGTGKTDYVELNRLVKARLGQEIE